LVRSKSSGEIEVISPVDTPPLVVQARPDAQSDRGAQVNEIDWNEEATV
jgi:hypothetical protein